MKRNENIEVKNSSFRDCRFLDRARVAQMVERHSASELQLEVGGSSPPPRAMGLAGATSEGQSFPGVTPSAGPRAGAQATGNHGGGWAVRFRPGLTTIRGGTLKKQHLASSLAGEREELRGTVTRKELGGGRAQSWVMFGTMEVRALPVSPSADHQDRPTSQGADCGQVPRRRPVLLHAAVGQPSELSPDVAVRRPEEGALEAALYLQLHVFKCSMISYITSRRGSSDGRAPRVRTAEAGDSIALLSSVMGPRGSTPRPGAKPGQVVCRVIRWDQGPPSCPARLEWLSWLHVRRLGLFHQPCGPTAGHREQSPPLAWEYAAVSEAKVARLGHTKG